MKRLPQPILVEESAGCLIVNKPGGLLTQAPPGIDSQEARLKLFLKLRDQKTGKVYLGVPHRLDRPASGIMLFAKNIRAARRLAAQFQQRVVGKTYWAVVEGEMRDDRGTWRDFMRKLPDQARSEITDANTPGSQRAVLHYQVKDRLSGRTWIEIELETGRTHQIRLQAACRGFPILGDALYGSTQQFGPATHDVRKRWIALHARAIEFEHPISHQTVRRHADLFQPWQTVGFDFPKSYVSV